MPQEKIDCMADKYDVKIVKLPDGDENVYEVSSMKRMGVTEFETVNSFAEAIVGLIEVDNSL